MFLQCRISFLSALERALQNLCYIHFANKAQRSCIEKEVKQGQNVYRYAVRGEKRENEIYLLYIELREKEIERQINREKTERNREREKCCGNYFILKGIRITVFCQESVHHANRGHMRVTQEGYPVYHQAKVNDLQRYLASKKRVYFLEHQVFYISLRTRCLSDSLILGLLDYKLLNYYK